VSSSLQFRCSRVNNRGVGVCACFLQAALLAGRTNKALVSREDFSQAVLRSVAGIEKKRSILQGLEKEVVARHEVST
jgi:cell division protease FtsH